MELLNFWRLDKAFLLDKNHRAFMAYQKFEWFRRLKEMSIQNYVTEFEGLYFKFKQHNMNLPDAVLAFRLLESCSLKELHFQLAMSTIGDITFDNMKLILRCMFTNGSAIDDGSVGSSTDGADSKDSKVKLEPVLQSRVANELEDEVYYASNNSYRGRGNFRGAY